MNSAFQALSSSSLGCWRFVCQCEFQPSLGVPRNQMGLKGPLYFSPTMLCNSLRSRYLSQASGTHPTKRVRFSRSCTSSLERVNCSKRLDLLLPACGGVGVGGCFLPALPA